LPALIALSTVNLRHTGLSLTFGGSMSWVLWLIGVVVAVIVGLAIFNVYDLKVATDFIRQYQDGMAKALVVAAGLIAISKFF
jgi:hypothetical protein